ncbi:MAG: RDD family protein [Candidatus Dormibacteraeota bacterium]|uniref:RDD family protein n=1 Tax=Candidatus Amunia macphersoniae TaxID=3127014 RepID=A0A934NE32_9BACT|nr:RDD family protein [Candidatus Dormibacteraeota bacterium]
MSTNPPTGETPPPLPGYPTPPSGGPVGYPAAPASSGAAPAYPAAMPGMTWAPPGPAPGMMYAGFWARFLGFLLDSLLLAAVEAIVTVPLLLVPLFEFFRDHPFARGQQPPLPSDLTTRFAVIGVLGAVVSALYFGGLVAWQGRTLGQRAAGTFVVRAEDGGKLPPGRAFLRAIVFWGPGLLGPIPGLGTIAGLVAFLAMLSVAWDSRKQGWHDKLGKSLVVKRVAAPGYTG